MAKRTSTKDGEWRRGWFFPEWLAVSGLNQTEVARRLDWPESKASGLVNGSQRYNQEILQQLADLLNVHPYELLMSPADANGLKQLRAEALQIAERAAASEAERLPVEQVRRKRA